MPNRPPWSESLANGLVDVWSLALDSFPLRPALDGFLTLEEQARASRFRLERDARRYRICHAVLRTGLGGLLGKDPLGVKIGEGSWGKPFLQDHSGVYFNLSHSGDRALIAVGAGGEVGVDIEAIRSDVEMEDIAAAHFTASESSRIVAQQSEDARQKFFFRIWTRKEAVLKATGSGIGGGLNQFDVSAPGGAVIELPGISEDAAKARWLVRDLSACPGYAAAVAMVAGDWQVREREVQYSDLRPFLGMME